MALSLTVNGQHYSLDVELDTPLLWVLRDELNLKGTKFGCGAGLCGACTVHVNGQPTRSCSTPVEYLDGAEITTIEGLSENGDHPLQKVWIEQDVAQCGYCQTGQIMNAAALLKQNPNPDDAAIEAAMKGNICRCGTYVRIKNAIKSVAKA